MKNRIFSAFLCLALLAGLLVVPGMVASADTITWQDGAVGQYAVVTEVPNETPLNQGIIPTQGASSTQFNANPNWSGNGNLVNLTDGDLTNKATIYFSQSTTQYWENITFDLGAVKQVDRALVGSAEAGPRNVYVKFYASTELATLYDASNLMAETKDGLSATELTVLLKGEAKAAQYVGISTYLFNTNQESGKYPGISGYGSQMRFSEIAVYAVEADEDGFYAADTGKYKVVDSVPTDMPINTAAPQNGITGTDFSRNQASSGYAYLTDGSVTSGVVMYNLANGAGHWYQFTFALDKEYTVDRLFVSSQEGGYQHVWVKFYASTELATLYDDSNLIAEKNGLTASDLNVLLKGEAKDATYVGFATYYPSTSTDKGTYPDIQGWSSNARFNELAVYEAPILWTEYDITATNNTDKIVATGDNLLATATATASAQQTLVTDGNIAGIVDGSGIWDSLFGGDDGSPAYTAFDLGSRHVIDSLLVGGGGNDTFANIGCGTYGVDVYISDYTREQIQSDPTLVEPVYTTTDTIVFGRLVELAEAATGRYVVFALYGAPSSSLKTKIWLSELAATGYAADAPTAQGAQVRGTDALRFGFDLVASGVKYADADPLVSSNYTRDLSVATITVDGNVYTLKDFGAVVSLNAEGALTLDSAATDATGKTKAVSAEKLYSITGDTVRFTAVVINIPAGKGDTPLYARAYVTYNDGTKDVTLYGDKITRSVNQCTAEALG